MGGRRTPRSGALFGADVQLKGWNVELRRTAKKTHILHMEDFLGGNARAWSENRQFIMRVEFDERLVVWVMPDQYIDVSEGEIKISNPLEGAK